MVKMEYINKTYGQNGVYSLSENEKIQKDVYESHGDLFQKSNALINGKYKASLMDQKILNIVLSKLEKRQFEDRGESEGLVCTLSAAELKNMLNVEGGSLPPAKSWLVMVFPDTDVTRKVPVNRTESPTFIEELVGFPF